MSTMLQLQVHALHCEARDVRVVELRDPRGAPLPAFTAGAHLELQLPNGLVRHYSLCNDPAERHRYCIGVGLACNSRGGSRYLHQQLHLGTRLQSSAPRNHFELAPDAGETVFIAGGIGITPIMAMIHHSRAQGRRWRLFYCARSRQRCAFYEDLRALAPEHCTFHFDDEAGGCFDPAAALAGVPMHAHVHTCGPAPLMDAVAAAARGRAPETLHFEWFSAARATQADNPPFTVVLRQSGRRLEVPPDRSILDVLEAHDLCVPYSCREGLCATCRTTVLAGEVDHRDRVLGAAERASHREMLICVSRARSAVLELDL